MKEFSPEIIWLRPDELTPYSDNSKDHPVDQVDRIAAQITRFGFDQPIVVDEQRVIIKGHGRRAASLRLGLTKVPCIIRKDLDDYEKRAARIGDNKVAESDWNADLLRRELEALRAHDGFDAYTGFDRDEVDKLLQLAGEPGCHEDQAPEVPKEPRAKRGQIYRLGMHRIMCGDSTDGDDVSTLMGENLADMVFTDPPYGVSFVGVKSTMYSAGKKLGRDSVEEIEGDDLRGEDLTKLFLSTIEQADLHAKPKAPFYIFFGINRSREVLDAMETFDIVIRNWLVWDKGNVGYHAMGAQYKPNFESFLYCHRKGESPEWKGDANQQTIWRHSIERLGLHPTMKPVALIEQALRNHPQGIVLDLFLGSGSTLIACEKSGRSCYGMELDPQYVDVIIERWEKYSRKKAELIQDAITTSSTPTDRQSIPNPTSAPNRADM